MEKSSEKGAVLTVGLMSALATICAALVGGVFVVYSTMLNRSSAPSQPNSIIILPASSVPEPTREPTSVPWTPGQDHPEYPHLVASDTVGKWVPENGYDWANPDNESDMQVAWSPGTAHDEHPNVVAADTEGDWIPAAGYAWAEPDNDDNWTVVRKLANIESLTVDHNVTENGQKGMKIHVKFTIEDLQDIRCYVGAYFYYANGDLLMAKSGDSEHSSSNGSVLVGSDFIPKYRSTTFEDFSLFMPYDALNMDASVDTAELKLIVKLYNWRDETFIAESDEYAFNYSQ